MSNRLLEGGFQDVDRTGAPEAFASGLPIEFRTADAYVLLFDDDAFDVAWTERVLVHVADPAQVVREMVRVVRPGGVVVIAEADYHAYVIDSPAVDIAQQLVARHAKAPRNPDIGRRVRRLCHEAGAAEVRMRAELRLVYDLGYANAILLLRELLAAAVVEGALPGKRAAAWWAGLEELDRAGRFLLGLPFFVAIARVGS